MAEIVRFKTADDQTVLVEADEQTFGVERVARGRDGILDATKHLEDALGSARAMATAALHALEGMGFEELSLEFGVKLSAEAGSALIAKASGEANLKITVKWGGAPQRLLKNKRDEEQL